MKLMCVHTHTYTYAHIYTYTYMHTYIYMYVFPLGKKASAQWPVGLVMKFKLKDKFKSLL